MGVTSLPTIGNRVSSSLKKGYDTFTKPTYDVITEATPKPLERDYNVRARERLEQQATQPLVMPERGVPGENEFEGLTASLFRDILAGKAFQDPTTSMLYRGLRDESRAEEEKGASAVRQFAQKGGMGRSGGALRAEGEYRTGMANKRTSMLGELFDRERTRDNEYTRAATGVQAGALQRDRETQKANAEYEKKLGDVVAPYTYQTPINQYLTDQGTYYTPQISRNASPMENLMSVISAVTPLVGLFKGGGSGGGGGSSGVMGAAGIEAGTDIFTSLFGG